MRGLTEPVTLSLWCQAVQIYWNQITMCNSVQLSVAFAMINQLSVVLLLSTKLLFTVATTTWLFGYLIMKIVSSSYITIFMIVFISVLILLSLCIIHVFFLCCFKAWMKYCVLNYFLLKASSNCSVKQNENFEWHGRARIQFWAIDDNSAI